MSGFDRTIPFTAEEAALQNENDREAKDPDPKLYVCEFQIQQHNDGTRYGKMRYEVQYFEAGFAEYHHQCQYCKNENPDEKLYVAEPYTKRDDHGSGRQQMPYFYK